MKKDWTPAVFALSMLFPAAGRAHLRNYLDTYGYDTLQKSHAEVEVHTDRVTPREGDSFWVNQTELEYGVTDRWTTSLYGVFTDGQGFSAAKWENRYRLADKGRWPVDVALYGEYKKANGEKDNDEVEGKLILAKDWGRWNAAANPIVETERERDEDTGNKEWETHPALSLGVSYHRLWGSVTPGLELFLRQDESRVTPGLYVDLLPGVRLNLGAGFGLVKRADKVQYKTLLEFEF